MLKEYEICDCKCHYENQNIMHFLDCCDLCYHKYYDNDDNFDRDMYGKEFKVVHGGHPPTLKELDDGTYLLISK